MDNSTAINDEKHLKYININMVKNEGLNFYKYISTKFDFSVDLVPARRFCYYS